MKILFFPMLLLVSSLLYAKPNLTASEFISSIKVNQTFNEDCTYSNHDILEADKILNINIKLQLSKFGDLSLSDFDMGECLSKKNIEHGILTTYFWQKNKEFKGKKLSIYMAYKADGHRLLLAVTDEDLNTYLIGDKDADLKENIKFYSADKMSSDGVNINSTLSYLDFSKDDDSEVNDSNEINNSKYSKEIDAILYPEWKYYCKRDRFDDSKFCSMRNNDIGVFLFNGTYVVSIGGDHYPGSKASLKVDDNLTLTAIEGAFTRNASSIIAQFKKGKIAYTRYNEWPYQYRNIDRESRLNGFTKTFNEMLETYKGL